jgi:hypothetical protein
VLRVVEVRSGVVSNALGAVAEELGGVHELQELVVVAVELVEVGDVTLRELLRRWGSPRRGSRTRWAGGSACCPSRRIGRGAMWTREGRWAIRAVIVPRPRASESAKEAAARSERRPLGRSEVSADGEDGCIALLALLSHWTIRVRDICHDSARVLDSNLGHTEGTPGLVKRTHPSRARDHAGAARRYRQAHPAGYVPAPTDPERLPNVIFPAPDLVFLWAPTLDLLTSRLLHAHTDGRVIDLPFLTGCHRRVLPGRPQALPDHPDMHLRPRVQLNRVVRFRHHVHRRRQRSAPLPRLPHRGPRGARRHGRLRALTHPRSPPHA